jgi:hypothetical protein
MFLCSLIFHFIVAVEQLFCTPSANKRTKPRKKSPMYSAASNMLRGEIPVIKKMSVAIGATTLIELANGTDMQTSLQNGTLLGICQFLTETVLHEISGLVDQVVPEQLVRQFAGVNIDIVQNIAAAFIYAAIARYLDLSPYDDYATIMGFLRSGAFAVATLSVSDVVASAI